MDKAFSCFLRVLLLFVGILIHYKQFLANPRLFVILTVIAMGEICRDTYMSGGYVFVALSQFFTSR